MSNSLGELDEGHSTPGSQVDLLKTFAKCGMRFEHKLQALNTPTSWQDHANPIESEKGKTSPAVLEADLEVDTLSKQNEQEFKQMDDFLVSHDSFLERLREKVRRSISFHRVNENATHGNFTSEARNFNIVDIFFT